MFCIVNVRVVCRYLQLSLWIKRRLKRIVTQYPVTWQSGFMQSPPEFASSHETVRVNQRQCGSFDRAHARWRLIVYSLHPAMIARQRRVADVTWVGAGGSRPRASALTMSLSAVSRTTRVCLTTGSGYGVVLVASLLVQTFCGCNGAQFDGQ